MTKGRETFKRAGLLIGVFHAFLKVMPRGMRSWLWSLFSGTSGLVGAGLRYAVARSLAAAIGECVYFGKRVEVRNWENLRIGSNVSIQDSCFLEAIGGICIGNNVSIAHQTSILSFEHTWVDLERPIRDNPLVIEPVNIDDDVWIGCGVRVLAGVHLRSRTVVAAGAVVTRSNEGGQLLGGVPAKPIKQIAKT